MKKPILVAGLLITLVGLPVLADTPPTMSPIQDLYDTNCTDCHGDTGQGNGPKARMLQPVPADLTKTIYKHGISDDEVFTTISKGVPGTSMPNFGSTLKEDQIHALVAYLKTLRHPVK